MIEFDKGIDNLLPGGQLGPRAALSSVFRGAAERVPDAGEKNKDVIHFITFR